MHPRYLLTENTFNDCPAPFLQVYCSLQALFVEIGVNALCTPQVDGGSLQR